MSGPVRIQRKRTKGWRMPEGAVYVSRPSQWGNPWRIGDAWDAPFVWHVASAARAVIDGMVTITPAIAVDLFRVYALECGRQWLRPLRGKDLTCWCPLCPVHADGRPLGVECPDCAPCHADALLELANR